MADGMNAHWSTASCPPHLYPNPPPSLYQNGVSSSQPPPLPNLSGTGALTTGWLAFLFAPAQPLLRRISTKLRIFADVWTQILMVLFVRGIENDHAGRNEIVWCCVVVCNGFALRLLSRAAPPPDRFQPLTSTTQRTACRVAMSWRRICRRMPAYRLVCLGRDSRIRLRHRPVCLPHVRALVRAPRRHLLWLESRRHEDVDRRQRPRPG